MVGIHLARSPMKTKDGKPKRRLLAEQRQDARLDRQLLLNVSALRESEHPLAVDLEGRTIAALAEEFDGYRRQFCELLLDNRCHLRRVQPIGLQHDVLQWSPRASSPKKPT